MKKKLIKFFEIGRLEKGLFRIWILLCIIYYPFSMYSLINEYPSSIDYRVYQVTKKDEKKNFSFLCQYFTKNEMKYFQGEWFGSSEKVYGIKKSYLFSTDITFNSKEECISYRLKSKRHALYNMIAYWSFFFFLPLILAITFLFSKKLILWLYRGFK